LVKNAIALTLYLNVSFNFIIIVNFATWSRFNRL